MAAPTLAAAAPPASPARGVLIALVGTTAWATTAIFISYLYGHYPIEPLTLAFWRDLFIALELLLILRVVRPEALRVRRQDLPFFLMYGFFGLALFNGMWSLSVKFNGAAVATVLAYSSPAITALLAWPILGERLTVRKTAAVLLSLAGCVLVAGAHSPEAWRVNQVGILVGLATGAAFAGYNIGGKLSARRFASPWTVTAYGFLFAAMGLLLTQRPATILSLGVRWDGWLILAALALGPTLAGFGLYTLSLRYLPASVAGLIASLEPAITAVLAYVILREVLQPLQWAGAGLILAAVVLVQVNGDAGRG